MNKDYLAAENDALRDSLAKAKLEIEGPKKGYVEKEATGEGPGFTQEEAGFWYKQCQKLETRIAELEAENKKLSSYITMEHTEPPYDYGDSQDVQFAIRIAELEKELAAEQKKYVQLKEGIIFFAENAAKICEENGLSQLSGELRDMLQGVNAPALTKLMAHYCRKCNMDISDGEEHRCENTAGLKEHRAMVWARGAK